MLQYTYNILSHFRESAVATSTQNITAGVSSPNGRPIIPERENLLEIKASFHGEGIVVCFSTFLLQAATLQVIQAFAIIPGALHQKGDEIGELVEQNAQSLA